MTCPLKLFVSRSCFNDDFWEGALPPSSDGYQRQHGKALEVSQQVVGPRLV